MNLPPEWLEKFQHYAYFGTLGAFAALVGYLWQVARQDGQRVTLLLLIATATIGFYLGMLFGGLIPPDWGNRDALVLLIGATGLKGFEMVYSLGRNAIPGLVPGGRTPPPPPPAPPADGT